MSDTQAWREAVRARARTVCDWSTDPLGAEAMSNATAADIDRLARSDVPAVLAALDAAEGKLAALTELLAPYDINDRPSWVDDIDKAFASAFRAQYAGEDAWAFDPRPLTDAILTRLRAVLAASQEGDAT